MVFAPLLLTATVLLSDEITMARGSDRPSDKQAHSLATTATKTQPQPTSSWVDEHLRYYGTPDQTHNVAFEFDFLWWTVTQNSLEYAQTKDYQVAGSGETTAPRTGNMGPQGTIREADFGWEPGFRGAFTYTFKGTPWFTAADWTFLESSNSNAATRPAGAFGYVTGLNLQPNVNETLSTIKSHLNFHYNTARLLFGAGWSIRKRLFFSLFVAPQSSWVKQNWVLALHSEVVGSGSSVITKQWYFRGYGFGVGTQTNFYLGRGVSLDLGGSVASQYGSQSYWGNQNIFRSTGAFFSNVEHMVQSGSRRFLWTTQIFTHLDWSLRFGKASTLLSLGYEINGLYNINPQYRTIPFDKASVTINNPDNAGSKAAMYANEPIFLHGLVLSATVGF